MEDTIPPKHQAPVEIVMEQSDIFVVPGNRIEIPFQLINHRNQDDFFEVSVRGVPSSWVIIPDSVIQIGPNDFKQASIFVLPPIEDSGSVVGVFPFYIRAASQESPEVFAEGTVTLRVGGFEYQGRISVLMDTTHFAVEPGTAITVPLVLQNQGLGEDNISLEIDGIPITWVSTSSPVVHLRAGESRQVNLAIQPPRTPLSKVGRNPFTILLVSQTDPSQVQRVECLLTVGAFNQFASDLSPHRLERDQPARIRILNQGNIQDAYRVDWMSQEQALEFIFPSEMPLRAQPGETAFLDFEVHRRERQWFGGMELFPFSVVVTSAEGESQVHNGEFMSRGLIPIWVIPVLTLLCLALICGGGFLWNRMNTGTAGASLTATAQVAMMVTQTAEWAAATETAAYNMTAAVLAGQIDTDGDGITDEQERMLGTDPNQADTDSDRLSDGEEVRRGLNPLNPDTDGDGILDGVDLDPLDPNNPSLTATALASLPTAAPTPVPPTAAPTNTQPPQATQGPAPTPTDTPPPPTAEVLPSPSPAPLQIPANGVLAFESNRAGSPDIYLIAPASGDLAPLAPSPASDGQPAWSPDGQRIVFMSNRDGNNEIYIVNFDGGGLDQPDQQSCQ
jgi:hypothetical protein